MATTSVQTALNVYIPSMPRLRPVALARVHRRRNVINLSIQERQEGIEFHNQSDLREEEGRRVEERVEGLGEGLVNLIAVNWTEFWKRTKIYPEQAVEYSDTSEYVSLRHRSRTQERARARANAYVSDTESDSDTESNTLVITCQGCKDGLANQMAHMDYGGCLCNDVVV